MRKSLPFWFDGMSATDYPPLQADAQFDVAIMGGGMVGLHTAHALKQSGLKVALFEARRIGRQATGRSTAKVTSQHRLKYRDLIGKFGEETARLHAQANEQAVARIAEIASSLDGRAELQQRPAYVYAETKDEASDLDEECDAARALGLPAELVEDAGLPFPVAALLKYRDQYQIHPFGYLAALAEKLSGDITIFEESRVENVDYGEPCRLSVNGHTVTADHVVVATQTPVVKDGFFFTKVYPFAHPMAAAPLPDDRTVDGMFISVGNPSHSFRAAIRNGTTYLVAAGMEYKTGEEEQERAAVEDLVQFLTTRFGIEEPTHLWTSEDFRPMDGAAFIGAATSSRPNLLVATGFDAWGLSQGALAGEIIAGNILGRRHPAAEAFEATRLKPLSGGGTFISENTKAGAHLVGDRLLKRHVVELREIPPGGGGIVEHNGDRLAVIRDADGDARAMSAVCTHMGCIVGWNETDRTFDCPCHGSRFDETGAVLYGPAVSPLEPRKLED